jgi:outer membrane protein assembly factor BamA
MAPSGYRAPAAFRIRFDLFYQDLSERLQWQIHLFDDRAYYLARDRDIDDLERLREAYQITGVVGSIIYPLTFYTRAELGVGYALREVSIPTGVVIDRFGRQVPTDFVNFDSDFPLVTGALIGDSTIFASYGPISGRRYRLDLNYAPDLDEGGALSSSVDLDVRQYLPLTRRTNLALRLFAGASEGNVPNPIYFGGLDTVRGFRFREFNGDRGFFTNLELRFPLIDILATPVIGFQGIRGVVFLDLGGAWWSDLEDFEVWDSELDQLGDAFAAYGYGITVRFGGLDLNWDFARRTNFGDLEDPGYQSSFWLGTRF